jgi:hypothetical protein
MCSARVVPDGEKPALAAGTDVPWALAAGTAWWLVLGAAAATTRTAGAAAARLEADGRDDGFA